MLADNMFILEEESGKMYIYVIEAYVGYKAPKNINPTGKNQNCLFSEAKNIENSRGERNEESKSEKN